MARPHHPSTRCDEITALIDRCLAEHGLLPSLGGPFGQAGSQARTFQHPGHSASSAHPFH